MSLTDVIIASKAGFLTGIRNLVPYPYNHTTKTENGITWTDNGDGTVHAKGTASARSSFYLTVYRDGIKLSAGQYSINTGIPNENANAFCSLEIVEPSVGYIGLKMKSYEGSSFVVTDEEVANNYRFTPMLYVSAGATVDVTFKPMLECGRIAHEYMPYYFGGAAKSKDADTVSGVKFYKSLSELGLTEATATPQAIVSAMQDHSMLTYNMSGSAVSSALAPPYQWGLLRVQKINNSYAMFEYQNSSSVGLLQLVRGYYNTGSEVPWSGWKKIADADKVLPLTGGKLTGNVDIEKATPIISLNDTTSSSSAKIVQTSGTLAIQNINSSSNTNTRRQFNLYNSAHSSHGSIDKCLKLIDIENNATKLYDVLTTANSQKVTITADKNTPPSTMEGLWAY